MKTMNCPCGSLKPYQNCCQRCHLSQAQAMTAEDLMRSRYSAYCLGLSQYLVDSHHRSTRESNLKQEVEKFIKEAEFEFLEILESTENTVDFLVGFRMNGESQIRREHSQFKFDKGIWYYLDFCCE